MFRYLTSLSTAVALAATGLAYWLWRRRGGTPRIVEKKPATDVWNSPRAVAGRARTLGGAPGVTFKEFGAENFPNRVREELRSVEDAVLGSASPPEKWNRNVSKGRVYVALHSGAVIGFICAYKNEFAFADPEENFTGWHNWVSAVVPEFEGKGVYADLFSRYAAAQPEDCAYLTVATYPERFPRMAAYLRAHATEFMDEDGERGHKVYFRQ